MEGKISLKVDVKPGKAGDPFSYVIDVSKQMGQDGGLLQPEMLFNAAALLFTETIRCRLIS